MTVSLRRGARLLPFWLALAGAALADAPAPPAVATEPAPLVATEPAAKSAETAIANFSLSKIKLTNTFEAGVPEATAEAFAAELARRLAERAAHEPGSEGQSKGTVEVRFDKLTVQGDFTRGKEGDPIPRDLFAATVRVLDDAGQEISIHVVPETQLRGDKLAIDPNKLLGVEGAAIVYRKLFGAL